MKLFNIFFVFIFVIIIGCTPEFNPNVFQEPLIFASDNNYFESDFIKLNANLGANNNRDTLILQINVFNKKRDTLWINTTNLQLCNSNKLRKNAVFDNYTKIPVSPKSNGSLRLKFVPINNLRYFQLTGMPGAIDTLYKLQGNLCYLNSKLIYKPDITFKLPPQNYSLYTADKATEKNTAFYKIDNNLDLKKQLLESFPKNSTSAVNCVHGHNHHTLIKNIKPSIQISESELMLQGLVIKLQFFKIDSTLNLNAKIINHGDFDLTLNMNKLFIDQSGHRFKLNPENIITSEPKTKDGHYTILKSGRIAFSANANAVCNQFVFLPVGLTYKDFEQKVVPEGIGFIKY